LSLERPSAPVHDGAVREIVPADRSEASSDLLERSSALATLAECLADVESSSCGQVVLVGGEAGVGKTSLLRRFRDGLETRMLWGECEPLFAPRPLGPLLEVAEETGGELKEVVSGEAMPHEVAAALTRTLRGPEPSVLVLEDVHWADEATLDVFRLMARRVERIPVLVVASYRDDELGDRHLLRVVLGELASSRAMRRIRLAPLSLGAVATLAEPHGVDADELYNRTAGNPFFVAEALAAGSAAIPGTVRDAVLARAARLGPSARTLLEAVAAVPPRAELWLLESLAPENVGSLGESLASGMLTSDQGAVVFRHELARLAIDESIAPDRKLALHRKALAALAEPPRGDVDVARLSHHAEAAGDEDAVLRYAPEAAAGAASRGSHREAVVQYTRALRFGERLAMTERADLLARKAHSCFVTDQYDVGIAAIEQELAYRRELSDTLREGDALYRLSEFLWCPGRTEESRRAAWESVAVLEQLPPGPELARSYSHVGSMLEREGRIEEAVCWARRALELVERVGDEETAVFSLATVGLHEYFAEERTATLELDLIKAKALGSPVPLAHVYSILAGVSLNARRHEPARSYIEAGLEFCSDLGLELHRLYLLSHRAWYELEEGRWSDAADTAQLVLRTQRTSITPRIVALVVIALVRARRGDPEVWPLLDEAWALAEPTGEIARVGPVAAARAEAAWLAGDRDAVEAATSAGLPLALDRQWRWVAGELAVWRRRAGLADSVPKGAAAGPSVFTLEGKWSKAAGGWADIGCPYEEALALGDADDDDALRRSLDALQELHARPAQAIVARRRGGIPGNSPAASSRCSAWSQKD
jgi:tetratricopeptide (TPR) repeat protein